MNLEVRKALGWVERQLSPSFSWCLRCGRPWNRVPHHAIPYSESGFSSCFALCEECWGETEPHERLPYYLEVVQEWRSRDTEGNHCGQSWQSVEALLTMNVLAGL